MSWLAGNKIGQILDGQISTTINAAYWCWDRKCLFLLSDAAGAQLTALMRMALEDHMFHPLREALPRLSLPEYVKGALS